MDPERFRRVDEVFARVLEAEGAERGAVMDALCAGDAELRRDVGSLLAAHDAAGQFLNEPATAGLGSVGEHALDPAVGRRFGAYEAVGRIGMGGMGSVYLARRRDEQFDKLVAVKVIHWWLDTAEVLRRFERERRVLARLQHPNIATLLDAGATEDGAPYIVMEHVDGLPIDRHCDEHRLGVDERLALFLSACDAVAAAHRSLIVHLDLKPSNILVTGDGLVKLVDFGIARLIEQDGEHGAEAGASGATTLTGAGRRAFTPAYAAPEQITGGALTTATDVYSLGVVLYELLTGARPFAEAPGRSIEDSVRETAPASPSVVVGASASGEGAAAGAARRSAMQLRRRLSGDLDNIALMAMRKEPLRRYASVEVMAEDIRRHLSRRTVLARPDTISYRTSRFLRRNRAPVGAAAAIVLALLGGVISVGWQARETAAQRDRAERRFGELRTLTNSLIARVDTDLASLPGATEARRALVTQATRYLDSLVEEIGDEPELLAELAASYSQMGRVQRNTMGADLGDTGAAVASHTKALELRERVYRARPESPEARRAVAESHLLIGDMLRVQGDFDGAAGHYLKSEEHHAVEDGLPQEELLSRLHHRAVIRSKLGIIAAMRGRHREAAEAYEESLAMNRSILERDPASPITRRNIAVSLEKLGDTAEALGDARGALDRYKESLAIFCELAEAAPGDAGHIFTVAISRSKIGEVLGHPSYSNLGDVDGALAEYREGRRLMVELLKIDPANARAKAVAAFFDRRIGAFLSMQGLHEEALRHQRDAFGAAERLARENPTDVQALGDVASCSLAIAETCAALGELRESLQWCMRAAEVHGSVLRINPELAAARVGLAAAWREAGERCAELAERGADPEESARLLKEADEWLGRALGEYEALEREGAMRASGAGAAEEVRERLALIRRAAAAPTPGDE